MKCFSAITPAKTQKCQEIAFKYIPPDLVNLFCECFRGNWLVTVISCVIIIRLLLLLLVLTGASDLLHAVEILKLSTIHF